MRVVLAILSLLTTAQPALPAAALLNPFIEAKMKEHLVPGLAVVAIRDGEVVHRQGYGSLAPSDPVIIGSLSKAITATAVMLLVERGLIDIDVPVARYLPDLRFADPAMRQVTVRHLLNQTSGIPTQAPHASRRDASLAEHAAALGEVRLVSSPGERHVYASPNYQLLGRIVEVVTGGAFGAYVQRTVFDPLRMPSSAAGPAVDPAPGHNLWWGIPGPSPYRREPGRMPTASMTSSADDLARFVLAHLGLTPLLQPESLDTLHRGVVPSSGFSYAMGWRDGPTAGVPSLWHGGAVPSYRSAIVMMPQSKSAVIVLTNMSTPFADHTREIAAGITALLEERPLPPPVRPLGQFYFVIALCSLILIALGLRGLYRASRARVPADRWTAAILDIVLPIAVLAAARLYTRVPFRAMWEGAPDVTLTVLILVVLSLVTGAVKLQRRAEVEA